MPVTLVPASVPAPSAHGLIPRRFSIGGSTVVALRGEADFASVGVLVDVLARVIAEDDNPVVVDLSEMQFIDTVAARVLGRARRFLEERDRRLTLRSPSTLASLVLAAFDLSDAVEADRATTA